MNVVTVHLQTDSADDDADDRSKPRTFSDIIRTIYSERGLRGFWKGRQTLICASPGH
ncbi:MC/SLC25 family protein [Lactococcus cremoris]|uniref:MC/SLC25 family protein n=1 Tax=Lactococcus lactis subsp. cremoris TaxID=1359 RepID=UPI00385283C6